MIEKVRKTLFLLFFMICNSAYSQTAETIATGRPGQSIGARVVGTNIFQIQSGYDFSKSINAGIEVESEAINNVLRYGLDEKYELSLVANYNDLGNEGNIGNVQIGGRVNLIHNSKVGLPTTCFQTRIQLIDGEGNERKRLATVSILASVLDMKAYGNLTANFIISNIAEEDIDLNGTTLAWETSLNSSIGYFIEHFLTKDDDHYNNNWNTGFSYLINKDLALDLSFGGDLEDELSNEFYSVGFSWRNL